MSVKSQIQAYGVTIGLAVALALVMRTWVMEPYRIPSEAMFPTLEAGDTVLVNKLRYRSILGNPALPIQLGDIIVFESPRDRGKEYIKRVVAVSGQRVRLENGRLWIDQKLVTVSPSDSPKKGTPSDNRQCGQETLILDSQPFSYPVCLEPPYLSSKEDWRVPDGYVFVLGDFRTESLPGSHSLIDAAGNLLGPKGWGMIPTTSVTGKAERVWLSVKPADEQHKGFKRLRWDRFFKSL
jgi:signal peptidase I